MTRTITLSESELKQILANSLQTKAENVYLKVTELQRNEYCISATIVEELTVKDRGGYL